MMTGLVLGHKSERNIHNPGDSDSHPALLQPALLCQAATPGNQEEQEENSQSYADI